jgi:hypothetical protein
MDGDDVGRGGVVEGTFRRLGAGRLGRDAVAVVRLGDRFVVRSRIGGVVTVKGRPSRASAEAAAYLLLTAAGGTWVYYPPPCRHRLRHRPRTTVA